MRKKLIRFKDNAVTPNLIEPGKALFENIRKCWDKYFGNHHPLSLELGCGKGVYTVALASKHREENFIGVDTKGARLWAGSQQALHEGLNNAAFLRTDIASLGSFFLASSIAKIYLMFPDPRPRDREEKKRLTNREFLSLYERLLCSGGELHFKTDSVTLFDYTCAMIPSSGFQIEIITKDLYGDSHVGDIHKEIQTPYEQRFLAEGKRIRYIKCRLKKFGMTNIGSAS